MYTEEPVYQHFIFSVHFYLYLVLGANSIFVIYIYHLNFFAGKKGFTKIEIFTINKVGSGEF